MKRKRAVEGVKARQKIWALASSTAISVGSFGFAAAFAVPVGSAESVCTARGRNFHMPFSRMV
jgi:hypothetical protein